MEDTTADDGRTVPTHGQLAKALWEHDTPAEALEEYREGGE